MVADDPQTQGEAETLADLRGLRAHYHAAKRQLARARLAIFAIGMTAVVGGAIAHGLIRQQPSVWSLVIWPLAVCVGMGVAQLVVFLVVRSRLRAEIQALRRQAGLARKALVDMAGSDPEMGGDRGFLRLLEQDGRG